MRLLLRVRHSETSESHLIDPPAPRDSLSPAHDDAGETRKVEDVNGSKATCRSERAAAAALCFSFSFLQ